MKGSPEILLIPFRQRSVMEYNIPEIIYIYRGKAMVNYPRELAQDAVRQSHTGHMTGLWFLPSPAFKAEY